MRGFSLTEVLLALLLATLTLTCLITVLIGGVRLLETSQEVAEATSVGRELMEAIKARQDVPAGHFDGPPATAGFPPPPYPTKQLKYAYRTKVEVVALDDWRKQVMVEVSWKQRASLRLVTVLPR